MNQNVVPDNFAKRLYILLLKRVINKRLISMDEIITKFGLPNNDYIKENVIISSLGTIDALADLQDSPHPSIIVYDENKDIIYSRYWEFPDICVSVKKANTEKMRLHLFDYYDL